MTTMTEFELSNPSNWNSNCFKFLHVCRHVLNTSLVISDTGCHTHNGVADNDRVQQSHSEEDIGSPHEGAGVAEHAGNWQDSLLLTVVHLSVVGHGSRGDCWENQRDNRGGDWVRLGHAQDKDWLRYGRRGLRGILFFHVYPHFRAIGLDLLPSFFFYCHRWLFDYV
jgi:hypothetical protein